MAEQDGKDIAAKSRIITHMNADHHDSIVRWLEYFCKLSSWQAYDGRMSGVDLNSMSFVCRGKTYHIPLSPPMQSYREARERAVQMDQKALEGLRRSDITIKEYSPPTGLYAFEFAIILATFLGYSQRWWFAEGQIVERFLGSGFARFSWIVQPYLITFLVVFHGSEMLYFMRNRLMRHSVNPRTALFWKWAGTAFLEGVFGFKRFDDLVKRREEAKAKQQH